LIDCRATLELSLSNPTTVKPPFRSVCRLLSATVFVVAACFTSGQLHAAAAGTAVIRGTVSNAATAANLGNASVHVKGTAQEVLTERDGSYVIAGLPAGTHEVVVSYVGLDAQARTVSVGPGETARLDFALTAELYKMDKFVVASEVEGNAAQLNKQKKSDVFMQSVSADMLGAIPQGNIGEFLKYIPGLLVDYGTVSDANTVSMRGQDAESTLFTFDGVVPAATGFASRAGNANDVSSRALAFRDTTIDNVESIEVFKAPPPWMAP
jgi:iron complex outermembrane recepter protein